VRRRGWTESIRKIPSLVSQLSLENRQLAKKMAKVFLKLTIFMGKLTEQTGNVDDAFAISFRQRARTRQCLALPPYVISEHGRICTVCLGFQRLKRVDLLLKACNQGLE
jgi:hypothetical protein